MIDGPKPAKSADEKQSGPIVAANCETWAQLLEIGSIKVYGVPPTYTYGTSKSNVSHHY
jgi:hypothetical protein